MAERSDITVLQALSPRVAEIASPSTEIVMQDYVDTLRIEEQRFQSMGFGKLINASGKEDLGGGVLVAITVQEQNLQLSFQPRTTPAQTGTVTTASGPASSIGRLTLTDTNADFITANIQPGTMVINFDDMSVSDVVRVIDANNLEARTLANGVTNEFNLNDAYHLFNITQVRTSGGNLVAVDDVGSSIPAILPTWGTQVVLTTSSSATIQELTDIQYAAFQSGVTVDENNSTGQAVAGTTYPTGTPRQPCLFQADAKLIADERGFNKIYVEDDLTTDLVTDWTGFVFVGASPNKTTITIPDASTVTDCEFEQASLVGRLDGVTLGTDCILNDVVDVNGTFINCGLTGPITLGNGGQATFLDPYSTVAGAATPIINIGTGTALAIRDMVGGIEFRSKTGTDATSVDMASGQVIVADSNTTGEIILRGVAKWTNEDTYAGTTTVTNELINSTNTSAAVWDALIANHTNTGSFGDHVARRLLTIAKFFSLKDA
jgi:hypothetical protein